MLDYYLEVYKNSTNEDEKEDIRKYRLEKYQDKLDEIDKQLKDKNS